MTASLLALEDMIRTHCSCLVFLRWGGMVVEGGKEKDEGKGGRLLAVSRLLYPFKDVVCDVCLMMV